MHGSAGNMDSRRVDGDGGGLAPPRYSKAGHDLGRWSAAMLASRVAELTPEQRRVTQQSGTERPFCGPFHAAKESGVYLCIVCRLPLFASSAKFDSGTGWPSFSVPVDPDHVARRSDGSHGMTRVEIVCGRCQAHLGHVFDDGPAPSGERHCVNGASLEFVPDGVAQPPESRPVTPAVAFFAGGCFWGVEHRFSQIPGVLDAESGYQGGSVASPSYRQVCAGNTGHAETVKVTFDPDRITYRQLVERFFRFHDPTTRNRQGPDVGTQYRSAIFTTGDDQERVAREVIAALVAADAFPGRSIVTEVLPAGPFWRAEDYHQDYVARQGGGCSLAP